MIALREQQRRRCKTQLPQALEPALPVGGRLPGFVMRGLIPSLPRLGPRALFFPTADLRLAPAFADQPSAFVGGTFGVGRGARPRPELASAIAATFPRDGLRTGTGQEVSQPRNHNRHDGALQRIAHGVQIGASGYAQHDDPAHGNPIGMCTGRLEFLQLSAGARP